MNNPTCIHIWQCAHHVGPTLRYECAKCRAVKYENDWAGQAVVAATQKVEPPSGWWLRLYIRNIQARTPPVRYNLGRGRKLHFNYENRIFNEFEVTAEEVKEMVTVAWLIGGGLTVNRNSDKAPALRVNGQPISVGMGVVDVAAGNAVDINDFYTFTVPSPSTTKWSEKEEKEEVTPAPPAPTPKFKAVMFAIFKDGMLWDRIYLKVGCKHLITSLPVGAHGLAGDYESTSNLTDMVGPDLVLRTTHTGKLHLAHYADGGGFVTVNGDSVRTPLLLRQEDSVPLGAGTRYTLRVGLEAKSIQADPQVVAEVPSLRAERDRLLKEHQVYIKELRLIADKVCEAFSIETTDVPFASSLDLVTQAADIYKARSEELDKVEEERDQLRGLLDVAGKAENLRKEIRVELRKDGVLLDHAICAPGHFSEVWLLRPGGHYISTPVIEVPSFGEHDGFIFSWHGEGPTLSPTPAASMSNDFLLNQKPVRMRKQPIHIGDCLTLGEYTVMLVDPSVEVQETAPVTPKEEETHTKELEELRVKLARLMPLEESEKLKKEWHELQHAIGKLQAEFNIDAGQISLSPADVVDEVIQRCQAAKARVAPDHETNLIGELLQEMGVEDYTKLSVAQITETLLAKWRTLAGEMAQTKELLSAALGFSSEGGTLQGVGILAVRCLGRMRNELDNSRRAEEMARNSLRSLRKRVARELGMDDADPPFAAVIKALGTYTREHKELIQLREIAHKDAHEQQNQINALEREARERKLRIVELNKAVNAFRDALKPMKENLGLDTEVPDVELAAKLKEVVSIEIAKELANIQKLQLRLRDPSTNLAHLVDEVVRNAEKWEEKATENTGELVWLRDLRYKLLCELGKEHEGDTIQEIGEAILKELKALRGYKADRLNVVAGLQQGNDALYKEREEVWEFLYEAIKGDFQHGKPPMATFTLMHMVERAVFLFRRELSELAQPLRQFQERRAEAFSLLGQAIMDDVKPDTLIERVKFIIECNKSNFEAAVGAGVQLTAFHTQLLNALPPESQQGLEEAGFDLVVTEVCDVLRGRYDVAEGKSSAQYAEQLRPYLRGKARQKVNEGSTVFEEVANELASVLIVLGDARTKRDDTYEYDSPEVSIGDLAVWAAEEISETHTRLKEANERITSARRSLGGLVEGEDVADTLEAYIANLWQQYHAKRALLLVRMRVYPPRIFLAPFPG